MHITNMTYYIFPQNNQSSQPEFKTKGVFEKKGIEKIGKIRKMRWAISSWLIEY